MNQLFWTNRTERTAHHSRGKGVSGRDELCWYCHESLCNTCSEREEQSVPEFKGVLENFSKQLCSEGQPVVKTRFWCVSFSLICLTWNVCSWPGSL